MKKPIISVNQMVSCYFRTSVQPPYRKTLVQITEWCNLHCVHCFVSAGQYGDTMSLQGIREILLPRLKECRVVSVTLTGGEPFAHADIIEIVSLCRDAGMKVGICTNATCISEDQMKTLVAMNTHCNVSLDGFSPESHGRFRDNKESFATTIATIKALAIHGILQGLLVTPNNLAEIEEYTKLCEFAVENGATYVLMNPLSSTGRGVRTMKKLGTPNEVMRQIAHATAQFGDKIEMVYIRFPNEKKLPLAGCEAGNIIYVFTPAISRSAPISCLLHELHKVSTKQRSSLLAISFMILILPLALTGTSSMNDIVSVAIRPVKGVVLTPNVAKDAPRQSLLRANALKKLTRKCAQSSTYSTHPAVEFQHFFEYSAAGFFVVKLS